MSELVGNPLRKSGRCKELRHSVKLCVTVNGMLLPAERGWLLPRCRPASRSSGNEVPEDSSESRWNDPFTDFGMWQSRMSY